MSPKKSSWQKQQDERFRKKLQMLKKDWQSFSPNEQQEIANIVHKDTIVEDVNTRFRKKLTFGQKAADKVALFGGSWTFIIIFAGVLIVWMIANTVLAIKAFDPFPFILLNLCLSTLAAIQAPIIMMSQNRQAEKDRLQSKNDYLVDRKTGVELRRLHENLKSLHLREFDEEILKIETKQTEMLKELLDKKKTRK